ncbi:hypothetical protein BGI15_02545 [Snodgrassella alvi]|nr:hypothetical protein BGI07_08315 [Snodgrassella alvi]ORF31487.1 hypothetical protein BGI10_05475 [Snodgrassella alvi]ORF33077.1 hypothetical protein BGI11_09565 [Snodgrassella alvi]ORF37597.1 hypothetical protein BGI13_08080 [Snodgrassella alvi]ORF40626.1 hypothetical protein BGI14_04485 [Snodgrassella alvi]
MIVIYRNNNNCILIEGKSLNSLWEQPKVTSTFFISGSGLDEIVENTILPDDIKTIFVSGCASNELCLA